ncbi:hypothetical protein [Bacteroides gallinarum]|uniref:hypothetical protein n=1 Tax=Bacteroides gallinarum TaxID=376806 RepID=UPI0003638ADB|nr:hypothetical protein [Bacteroides gallinarum]
MAGIFASVDSDIKKLHLLREEIENIKKALKGINVKVDIDIAKGLEARLKSLSEQYDALVTKVSEAEGKILISTKRINDAAEKIVKAQEQVSKNMGVSPSNSNTVNTTANNTETASVQAQAKAYDDLANEINSIIGTREQNIKRMLEEQNAIRLINAEIKQLTKHQSNNQALSVNQQKRLEQLNNSLLTHKAALAEVRQALNNNAKLDNAAATSMDALSQSLGRMRTTYRQLTEEERNSPFGRELLASINQADAKIKSLDSTIGVHARNVGNYASGWNGLNMSIQQVGRELPSLAVSWNTFFLAISNNLPILADEIKRAKIQYEALKNSGQKAVPVWKQVVSSIFSWQSALTVGITLLTLYGGKVVDWIAGLFKAKDALSEMATYQQNLSKIMSEGAKDSARERVELDALYQATQNHAKSLKERNAAADELQKKYPSYFNNLSNEAILAGDAASAYRNLTDNILKAAQARAAMKIIEENYNKIYQLQKAINADTNWTNRNREKTLNGTATSGYTPIGTTIVTQALTSEAAEYNKRMKALQENKKAVEALKDANNALIESIDVTAFVSGNGNGLGMKDINTYTEQLQHIADLRNKSSRERVRLEIDLGNQEEQARIDAMQDGFEKEQAQRRLNNKKELQTIEKQKQDYISKIVDVQRQIFEAEENAKASKDKNYKKRIFDASSVSVDTSIFGIINKAVIQKQANEIAAYYNEILSKYQDYATKRLNAEKQYQRDLEKLEKAGATGAQKDELAYQRDETLKSIDKEFAMREDSFQSWADSIADMSLRELQRLLTDAEKELERMEFLSPNSPELAELRAKINTLNEQIGKSNNENTASPNKRSIKEWQDLYKTLQKVEHGFEDLGDAVGGVAGEILSTAGEIASSTLQMVDGIMTLVDNSSSAIKGVSEAASKSISTIEKASVILTIISSAIQLLQEISELGSNKAFKQYEAYAEKAKEINALTDAVNQYRIAALEAQQAEAGWFSTDNLRNLRDYKKVHDEVYEAYVDKAMESQAVYQNQSGGGWLTGAFNWVMGNLSPLSWWDDWKNIWGQGDYDEGMTAAINNLRIETRKKSSGFLGTGIGGHSQKTEDLATWARNQGLGELFDDEGLINKELAQSLIDNYGDKLVGQTKETLEALIELREQYDEYIEQLHEYVSSLYEPLVDNVVDSLWDWLDNGKDALDSFKDYASDTFRDIVSDMMRTIVLDKVIGDFDDDIAKLYEKYASGKLSEEELMKQVANRTGSLIDDYERNLPALENILSTVNGYFKDAGIDLAQSEDSTREASQKGIATASQDSVDENNGRLAVIQSHTYTLNENVSRMANGIESLLSYSFANLSSTTNIDKTAKAIESQSRDALNHLANIDNYTSNLVEIKEYMYAMKSGIDTLNTKGIALKR